MNNKDWNPNAYLQFHNERLLPSVDLVARIDSENPQKIIDVGCGPGNSTQVLYNRWPKAQILGIDNSSSMIEKARLDYPDQKWEIMDAEKDVMPKGFDIVFSNATIQWIPDHAGLIRKFKLMLNTGGTMAIQLPLFFDMPLGQSIQKIALENNWSADLSKVSDLFTIHPAGSYYNMMAGLFSKIQLWETSYIHVFNSHQLVLEMIHSTGLRPYLQLFDNETEKKRFEDLVFDSIRRDYPDQEDGKVLFPFKRLFLVAKN